MEILPRLPKQLTTRGDENKFKQQRPDLERNMNLVMKSKAGAKTCCFGSH